MDLKDLQERYTTLPFTDVEFREKITERVWQKCINFYNKYFPQIKHEKVSVQGEEYYTFIGSSIPNHVLRVYYASTLSETTDPDNIVGSWRYDRPTIYLYPGYYLLITTYNWTLDSIELDDHPLLDSYVENSMIVALANKRRAGNITELPIDLKGDQFFGEAIEAIRDLETKITELVPIHY